MTMPQQFLPLHLMLLELTAGYTVNVVHDNHCIPASRPRVPVQPHREDSSRSLHSRRSRRSTSCSSSSHEESQLPQVAEDDDRPLLRRDVGLSRWESCPILKCDRAPSAPVNPRRAMSDIVTTQPGSAILPPKFPSRSRPSSSRSLSLMGAMSSNVARGTLCGDVSSAQHRPQLFAMVGPPSRSASFNKRTETSLSEVQRIVMSALDEINSSTASDSEV